MSETLAPYPEYRDSGASWLGAVPNHWEVLPNRTLFSEIDDRNHPEEDLLSVTIAHGVIPQRALLAQGAKKDSSNEDKSAYKLVSSNDIAYNKMRAWQGAVGISRYRGIVSPAYVVVRPRQQWNPRYFHYLFRTPAFAQEAERWSYGITSDQWSLRPQHFKMIYSAVPPTDEQTDIVRFLDHTDRRVRHYLASKTRLIDLINEERELIIQRAVTKGLDPGVELKPSGAEWLDDVPEHWEVLPLKRRWRVRDCKHLTVPFVDDGIPVASVREVQSFNLSLDTANRTTSDWYDVLTEGGRAPRHGDLVYCRNVSVGAAAFVDTDERFAMGQDVCLIRSDSENQRYLNYFLHSPAMKRQLALLLVGSTFDRINVADVRALIIAVPPQTEQDAIAAHLDAALGEYDRLIADALRQCDLMREYRTRLIVDVVTGKLDVRGAARALPIVSTATEDDAVADIPLEHSAGGVANADMNWRVEVEA